LTLPGGTVTFLFSDIEGSTRLLEQLGDRYGDVHRDHRRILREQLTQVGGQEIDTQGDAFFFCFQRARDAVAGAVAAQRGLAAHQWPDGTDVRVRMSLHTGEPVVGEEGYVGVDVHRAARICAAGHGGQVLLSGTTAALVAGGLPDGVEEVALGEVRLKDLERPERVYQLAIEGLPRDFPPLRADAEKPMDLGERLSRRIQEDVEQQIEEALAERGSLRAIAPRREPRVPKTTRLAAAGLLNLVLLVAAVVAIVLLVRIAL
jgi:class 3 adenylate cyclase